MMRFAITALLLTFLAAPALANTPPQSDMTHIMKLLHPVNISRADRKSHVQFEDFFAQREKLYKIQQQSEGKAAPAQNGGPRRLRETL